MRHQSTTALHNQQTCEADARYLANLSHHLTQPETLSSPTDDVHGKGVCVSWTALLTSFSPSYFVFLVPLLSVTPGRFAHRLLSYLWTDLAFSRDFHMIPYVFLSLYRSP